MLKLVRTHINYRFTTPPSFYELSFSLCTYYSGWMPSWFHLYGFAELWGTRRERNISNENICLQRDSNQKPYTSHQKLTQCLRPLGSSVKQFTFSTSNPELLNWVWWHLVWMKYSRSLTSVVVFRPYPDPGWARICHGGPLLQRTSLDRKATATTRMHSKDLEVCGKKVPFPRQFFGPIFYVFSDVMWKVSGSNPAGDIYFEFSIPARSEQLSGSHANEIKHDHSPVVILVLDLRYD